MTNNMQQEIQQELSDLICGIGVVVDDEVNNEMESAISDIVRQLSDQKIPMLKYSELPDAQERKNLYGSSFIILDWELLREEERMSQELKRQAILDNIEFIQEVQNEYFCPIFIFSNSSEHEIKGELERHNLDLSMIFVRNKTALRQDQVFQEISTWVRKNSAVYVLKKWEKYYRKAKTDLFREFYSISPQWVKILWETYQSDHINESEELNRFIFKNIETRCDLFEFQGEIINQEATREITSEEMKKVLVGQHFVDKKYLNEERVAPGDIFKIRSGEYYINVRPACDCVVRGTNQTLGDLELYLIGGDHLSNKKFGEMCDQELGQILMQDVAEVTLPIFVSDQEMKCLNWRFKNFTIKKYDEIKDKRIGRLLPPYINRLQQRYSLYLQRQGLPRIPRVIMPSENAT